MIRVLPVLLLLALLAAPAPALAQSEPQPPATPAPAWSSIPDLIGYVSIAVPQCATMNIGPGAEAPVNWFDIGSVIGWLSANIENYVLSAICWGGYYLQILANGAASAINLVIAGINGVWRMLIFAWLTIRNWLLTGWYVLELVRQWWSEIQVLGVIIQEVIKQAQAAFVQFLEFLAAAVQLIAQAAMIVIGGIGWLVGLVLPALLMLFSALGWTVGAPVATPAPLAVEERYYCAVHGALRGFTTSTYTNWIFVVLFALVWVGFIFWFARFMSSAQTSSQ